MRTKEFLEINKEEIYFYDEVKKAIYDLNPLRLDKSKTYEYFNNHLFADARYRSLKYNNKDLKKSDFKLLDGEIDLNIAYKVRIEILNAISTDETYIFAYNIIAS